jgi:hypothetical protein
MTFYTVLPFTKNSVRKRYLSKINTHCLPFIYIVLLSPDDDLLVWKQ